MLITPPASRRPSLTRSSGGCFSATDARGPWPNGWRYDFFRHWFYLLISMLVAKTIGNISFMSATGTVTGSAPALYTGRLSYRLVLSSLTSNQRLPGRGITNLTGLQVGVSQSALINQLFGNIDHHPAGREVIFLTGWGAVEVLAVDFRKPYQEKENN